MNFYIYFLLRLTLTVGNPGGPDDCSELFAETLRVLSLLNTKGVDIGFSLRAESITYLHTTCALTFKDDKGNCRQQNGVMRCSLYIENKLYILFATTQRVVT